MKTISKNKTIKEIKCKGRRDNGNGSVFQKSDGKWVATITIGKDVEGKRIRKTTYGDTKDEVLKKMEQLKMKYEHCAKYIEVEKESFNALFLDWLMVFKKSMVTARTFENNVQNFKKHIEPYTKNFKLHDVTPLAIQRIINYMLDKDYSNQTCKKVKFLLNQFFEYAMDNEWINVNPINRVKVKMHERKVYDNNSSNKYKAISPETREDFIKALNNDESPLIKPLCYVLMFAGLRIGEALALKWKNVDFNNKTLKIECAVTQIPKFDEVGNILSRITVLSDTKTTCSVREIPLMDVVVDALIDWKDYQKYRNNYHNIKVNLVDSNSFIFANDFGEIRSYEGTRSIFMRFLKRHNLDNCGIHFHGLRHTFSNMLFEMNENPKVIQQLLGHRDVKTTVHTKNRQTLNNKLFE